MNTRKSGKDIHLVYEEKIDDNENKCVAWKDVEG